MIGGTDSNSPSNEDRLAQLTYVETTENTVLMEMAKSCSWKMVTSYTTTGSTLPRSSSMSSRG